VRLLQHRMKVYEYILEKKLRVVVHSGNYEFGVVKVNRLHGRSLF